MKLLHNLRRWARNCAHWAQQNKIDVLCVIAAIVLTAMLIVFVIAYTMGQKEVAAKGRPEVSGSVNAPPTAVPLAEPEPVWTPDQAEIEAIARTLYAECRGVESVAERAAVAWCILNRVDDPGYPDTVLGVLEQPYQFVYDPSAPLWPCLERLAMDVLTRHHREKSGEPSVGRTLPAEYLFFDGDGSRNWFTVEWKSDSYWDWSLPDPYAGEGEK